MPRIACWTVDATSIVPVATVGGSRFPAPFRARLPLFRVMPSQPNPPSPYVLSLLADVDAGRTLDESQAHDLFSSLLAGELDEERIKRLLVTLHARRATVDEIVGAARVMRAHVTPIPLEPGERVRVIDTCGTGGAPKAFNVSTAAALVAAAAAPQPTRILVAKHGNRSRTGRGSAEILAALGVNVDASPAVQARCLREAGVCFCFAIHHHPAMRYAGPARRSLSHPTIFNALGPMTNPAAASRQLIGVYDPLLVDEIARALARLGASHAIIAHSQDGLDELSTTSPTALAIVRNGVVTNQTLDATALGLPRASLAQIQASDLDDAARIFRDILEGRSGPHLDMVLLNAAAALIVADAASDWQTALALARHAVASGGARSTLATLAACSHRPE